MGDDRTGIGAEDEEDEIISIYPKMVPSAVQSIFFVLSSQDEETQVSDPDKLRYAFCARYPTLLFFVDLLALLERSAYDFLSE